MAAYAIRRPGKTASRWIDFGLGTAAVMLLLTAGIGALGTVRLFNSQADVDRVNETISGLEQLLSLAQDMETGQRGYVLTGKPGYLQPYLDARPKIDRQFERLNTLLRDEAVQRQRLAKLRALLDQKQIELAHTIWLRRIEGLQAAQAVIGNDTGKALMDQARGIVSDMEATARSRLTVLHKSARSARDAAIMVGLLSGGLTLVVCLSFGYMMRRLLLVEASTADALRRKSAELEHALESLRESEKHFRATFDQAAVGIAHVGQDGRWLRVNQKLCDIVGYTREELLTMTFQDITHPDDLDSDLAQLRQMLDGQIDTYTMEKRYLRKDGSEVWGALTVALLRKDSGKPDYFISVVVDITERRRAEEALRQRTEELSRSNGDLEQFAYVASHDLQEPLRAIAGPLQLLQRRYQGQLDARADEYIGHAVDGAGRMQALIDDLLAFSRVGRSEASWQLKDASRSLENALRNLSVAIEESGAQITHDGLPTVYAISGQLTLLFQNLVGNAIKFRSKERPVQIHVGAEARDDAWLFRVEDNGIGIDPQYFERIFLIFQRLHTRRDYPGTGLGLALCKRIVEHHGGRIWVSSEPGKGTTFFFTLPRQVS